MVLVDGTWEPMLAQNATKFERPTTIHHWQLRDLVACDDHNSLYCVHEYSTVHYDIATGKPTVIQSLGFPPYCMTVGHGYIAAGGPNSQINIKKLRGDDGEVFAGEVGGIINNALRIAEGPLGHLLFVCNNDETIKVFSLPSMEPWTTLKFKVAMNYSAVSPDCQWLVGVGDCLETFLYEATPTGYQKITEMREYNDVGICCDWDTKGMRFAAASQDGSTCVWDRRICKPVHKFSTSAPCRNVKFSTSPVDLMVFAEETDCCHLVDTRKLSRKQTLRVTAGPEVEPEISGICFSHKATRLCVGMKDGVMSYEIDAVARRRFSEGSLI